VTSEEFVDAVQKLSQRFNSGEIGLGEWTDLVGPLVEAREKAQATEREERETGDRSDD